MRKNVVCSLAIVGVGIVLLFVNKLLTANTSVEGIYISTLRQPIMVIAYVIVVLGILNLVYSVFKNSSVGK